MIVGGYMNQKYIEECESCLIDAEVKKTLCPYCMAQKVIKGKWKLLIFWHLQQSTKRFNELSRLIPSTQSTLARQLRELENDGVINRKVYQVVPPKVEYSLSKMGIEFSAVTDAMNLWGLSFLKASGLVEKEDQEEK